MMFPMQDSGHHFTRMHAYIVEDDDGFTVRIWMFNHLRMDENARGEEEAPTFDTASMMVGDLALAFGIPPDCISLRIVMARFRDGTIH